ncbi:MAG: Ig-like domain-containing protein, partial [Defluviitaleaceae bacterium]|nr:Ig-like domain-containing protein [Defluviitaleaceae bacterium]
MKKATGIILFMLFVMAQTITGLQAAQVPMRDGYTLAPLLFGAAGVETNSTFVLRTPTDYATNPQILIDGQSAPQIVRQNSRTFTITPAVPLTHNSVYVFRLPREDGAPHSWAFQTATRFEITQTLPRTQSTNVPVNTGIEISFSRGDAPDISEYFSIYPYVEGRFISRDSTAIFMPRSPLAFDTVYTVTISAGIGLVGTNERIETARMFAFETAPAPVPAEPRRPSPTDIWFSSRYIEFPSFEAPSVNFWINYHRSEGRPAIEFNLYKVENTAEVISAVTRILGSHHWARSSREDVRINTEGLTPIHSQTVTQSTQPTQHWSRDETFTLPTALPQGFYVLDATTSDGARNQVVIQITDLAAQLIADDENVLLWINDMNTGLPVRANIFDPISRRTFAASEQGIAIVPRRVSDGEYLVINADELDSIIFLQTRDNWWWHGGWYTMREGLQQYWTALQLDRTLFQRDDTLYLWGFVQNRRAHEEINFVTAVLGMGSFWGRSGNDDILHRENIPVNYGTYSGSIRLPHLSPGAYVLDIFHGDILLNSVFFTVDDYVTPPYRLTVSASHAAVFAGEEVVFTARTEFFEGTPVPDFSLTFGFGGHELTPSRSRSAETTDMDGVVNVPIEPVAANDGVQGQRSFDFSAEATLPEIGWVHERASVRVFVNDINVQPRASRNGADATISVDVHDITLDRINNDTAAHWGDFLCEPRAAQDISVEIWEMYWEAQRDGEFYCHVTRTVVPRYRHTQRENRLETFTITTGADGVATRDFTVPNRERRSYQARISTTDGNGRTIRHTVFIGRDFTRFFESANDTHLFLYGVNQDGYDIGDEVELTVMRGTEQVTMGNFLFVIVQGGIVSYHVGENSLRFTFDETHMPNAQVFAYHFNGHTYNSGWFMQQPLRFNPQNRQLVITVETCQEEYRPGETPTIIITTTCANGNPKAANINISLVDEALFALMDYTVDTLAMLYRRINDSLRFTFATHSTFVSDGIGEVFWGMDGDAVIEADGAGIRPGGIMDAPAAAPMAMPAASPVMDSGGGTEQTRIRERFEDTAVFLSVRTNAQGTATLNFPLPDNITSWRVTASGISNTLYAGNSVQNLRVTMPMFLHYTLADTFLVGDIPTMGVSAFGTELTGGNQVRFQVWREDFPEDIRTATGAAFERVNISLWEKTEEGVGAIVIHADVAGFSDAVRHEYQVVLSHRLVDTAVFHEVTEQSVFAINPTGLTNITFANYGRGQFLNELLRLRNTWFSGGRIEGLVVRREATALMREHFSDVRIFGTRGNFDISNYQQPCGGISILPHADAELEVTVRLLPFIKDDVDLPRLRNYLRRIFAESETDNKMLALYGLAQLGDPVLFDLQNYAMLEGLSVRNTAYVALGLAAIGDIPAAQELFNRRIAPHIQRIDHRRYRINAGENNAEIWDATSATALLAAKLELPQAVGLHNYASSARQAIIRHDGRSRTAQMNDHMLLNLEHLNFIRREIENHSDERASISYTLFGDAHTRDLGNNGRFNLRIPAQNFYQFALTDVTGEVGAVSIVRQPLENIETISNDITITREFFRPNSSVPETTFAQDDLVRVQITVTYSATDLTGTYVITDFLPAGLTHVANSARFGGGESWRHNRQGEGFPPLAGT